jgi:predicted SnoaL-like aldol condensation-catalyzing enzyme
MLFAGDARIEFNASFLEADRSPNWVVVDILRLEDGIMVEHWDVIQDEAKSSASGRPMFGEHFPI